MESLEEIWWAHLDGLVLGVRYTQVSKMKPEGVGVSEALNVEQAPQRTHVALRALRHAVGMAIVAAINPRVLFAPDNDARLEFWLTSLLGAVAIPLVVYAAYWLFFTRHARRASLTPVFAMAWLLLGFMLVSPWEQYLNQPEPRAATQTSLAISAVPTTQPTRSFDIDGAIRDLSAKKGGPAPNPARSAPAVKGETDEQVFARLMPKKEPAAPAKLADDPASSQAQLRNGRRVTVPVGCEPDHEVDLVAREGSLVKLTDGSIWVVDSADAVDSGLWIAGEAIAVCRVGLVNLDTGDVVSARRAR